MVTQLCPPAAYSSRPRHFDTREEFPLVLDRHLVDSNLCSNYSSRFISAAPRAVQQAWRNTLSNLNLANSAAGATADRWTTRLEFSALRNHPTSEQVTTAFHLLEVQPRSYSIQDDISATDKIILRDILREYSTRWENFARDNPQKMREMGFNEEHPWQTEVTLYGVSLSSLLSLANPYVSNGTAAPPCALTHEELAAIYLLVHLPVVSRVENGQESRVLQIRGDAPLTPEEVYSFYQFSQLGLAQGRSFLDMPFSWNQNTQTMALTVGNHQVSIREACLPKFVASSQVSAIREYLEQNPEYRIAIDEAMRQFGHLLSPGSLLLTTGLMFYHIHGERLAFNRAMTARCIGTTETSRNSDWQEFLQYRRQQLDLLRQSNYRAWQILQVMQSGPVALALNQFYLQPSLETFQNSLQYPPLMNLFLSIGILLAYEQAGRVPYNDFVNRRCPQTQTVRVPATAAAPVPVQVPSPSDEASLRNRLLAVGYSAAAISAIISRHGPAIMSALRLLASGTATLAEVVATVAEAPAVIVLILAANMSRLGCHERLLNRPADPDNIPLPSLCPTEGYVSPDGIYK